MTKCQPVAFDKKTRAALAHVERAFELPFVLFNTVVPEKLIPP